jgi:hypothetical protein
LPLFGRSIDGREQLHGLSSFFGSYQWFPVPGYGYYKVAVLLTNIIFNGIVGGPELISVGFMKGFQLSFFTGYRPDII